MDISIIAHVITLGTEKSKPKQLFFVYFFNFPHFNGNDIRSVFPQSLIDAPFTAQCVDSCGVVICTVNGVMSCDCVGICDLI